MLTTKTLEIPTPERVPAELLRHSTPAQSWQLATPTPMLRVGSTSSYRPTRREFLIGAGSLLVLAPYGCGGDNGESDGGGETTSSGSRTIEHEYGSTEVSGTPERVVTVGFTDQDPMFALGVEPVAVREWIGDYPNAVWPWAQDDLGEADLAVLTRGELNFERIAGLEPDLIVGVSAGLTEDQYETLSEIAPTIAQPKGYVDFGVPWEAQTRIIGRALGREERAEELISEVEARFETAREAHPEFEGATGVVVGLSSEDESYTPSPYGPQDARSRFLTSLGFEIPGEISDLVGNSFFTDLSRERLDLLDADVLVWVTVQAEDFSAVRNDPLYQQLDVAQQGRDVFLEQLLAGALSFSTVLSLPFALDRLVPRLAAAVDGETTAETTSAP